MTTKNKILVRKLRAQGDKVIHFLRFFGGYGVQTRSEMQALAQICEPSQKLIMAFEAEKLECYIPKLVRAGYRIVIGN